MRLGPRQGAVCYIKIFIQDLRVCGRIENIDKIFVLCSFSAFLPPPSFFLLVFSSTPSTYSATPLLPLSSSRFARRAPSIRREDGSGDPSFRTNRRVSIVERSTRHASSRDARDVNEGRFSPPSPLFFCFITSYPYSRRVNPLSRIIDVLISLNSFFS